jgi:hypothetical protein
MKTAITILKKAALLSLFAFTLNGCGKNEGDASSVGLSNSPTASSPSVLQDEGVEDSLEVNESPEDSGEDSSEEENEDKEEKEEKEEKANYSLPLDTTLISQHCFFNKEASLKYGTSIYSKGEIRFNKNGKGGFTYQLYKEETCEKKIKKVQKRFTYSISKTHDRVMVIFVKITDKHKVSSFWLNVVPLSKGVIIDLDASQWDSSSHFSEPIEEETAYFSKYAEEYGVYFEKKGE